jgi:hypothetical protein
MLSICYWWYNNVATIAATLFFLSCLLYFKRPHAAWTQVSYVVSLALLGLMKPNVAFPAALAGIVCTFVAASEKTRVLILTFSAVAMNIAFLAANHVSLFGMMTTYLGVADTRGFATVGLDMMQREDVPRLLVCELILAIPFLAWWPQFRTALRQRNHRDLAYVLLLLSAPAVSLFAMCTNMDLKDVEWPLPLCFGVVLLDAGAADIHVRWRKIFLCFVLALMASDLYLGAIRDRVRMIGPFFTTNETLQPGLSFFGNMQASRTFYDVNQELREILPVAPRPVFFGPRMEFGYAAFGLPSPAHLPVGWDPGTTFPLSEQPEILQAWHDHCFEILIFSKHDFTYYSAEFVKTIRQSYELNDDWPRLTVLRRRSSTACTAPIGQR